MKRDEVFIRHILEEMKFLTKETRNLQFEELMENEVLKRACTRSLEVIGEAVKNLSGDFKKKHPEIEWKKVAGLRDKLIHHYFGVNWDVVWDVITNKLPALKDDISKTVKGEKRRETRGIARGVSTHGLRDESERFD
jgi:uncharacterized protein with HEPN domain